MEREIWNQNWPPINNRDEVAQSAQEAPGEISKDLKQPEWFKTLKIVAIGALIIGIVITVSKV